MIGLVDECVRTSLRCEVVASGWLLSSNVTAVALTLVVLVSIAMRKVTFVQIACSVLPKL